MREIALDTETTGFDPLQGHRIVEIGCVELINHIPTGVHFHRYINPERDVPAEAVAVHGLTTERLMKEPVFSEVVGDFLEFIGGDPLVIHNAAFDMNFLNAELVRLGLPAMPMARALDTVGMARRMFPGAPASLDALCRRYGIDNSNRVLHGALLDAQLLGEVYLELRGGRQPDLVLGAARSDGESAAAVTITRIARPPRPHAPTEAELAAHAELLGKLKNPIWTAEAKPA
ncbi:DNA polymerase III subunit epsilon [Arenibaculum pallidiluteum]|uniref:DNA polymerase III subunit epsilon n=1 Tax=Arenibaculum pallidiluteum TaxID=2812559 RepID=UPI001A956853|nr:DNA polymerase III subunit epsilon [Arenibaculum pallidiluteum]